MTIDEQARLIADAVVAPDYIDANGDRVIVSERSGIKWQRAYENAIKDLHHKAIIDAKDAEIQRLTKERDDLIKRFEGKVAVPVGIFDTIKYILRHDYIAKDSEADRAIKQFLTAN